jgi:hypothetical protein
VPCRINNPTCAKYFAFLKPDGDGHPWASPPNHTLVNGVQSCHEALEHIGASVQQKDMRCNGRTWPVI